MKKLLKKLWGLMTGKLKQEMFDYVDEIDVEDLDEFKKKVKDIIELIL